MNIMVIGGGGREHAMAWQMAQFPTTKCIWVAPGNAGTALEPKLKNVTIQTTDINGLIEHAKAQCIDLTLVGPEAPLAAGLVDQFIAQGLVCFGPTQQAAQLESSKAYSKDFMRRHGIPTARYRTFTDYAKAADYLTQQTFPLVIKASGLAAGKGVIIAQNQAEALAAANIMLAGNGFGSAGHQIVVEEFLKGEEVSFIAVCEGETALPLATSQDHKARDDGDQGPNTGGMGAYSPAPCAIGKQAQIMAEVIEPTLQGMLAEGTPYRGFLYAGLMLLPDGTLRVLEFNCRLGDPETQPLMCRLKTNLAEVCVAALEGRLAQMSLQWDQRTALGVVMAAGGYPNHYERGALIEGLADVIDPTVKVFHSGTLQNHQQAIQTHGGRVLCVTALGETLPLAQQKAYQSVQKIHWKDVYYRTDIGAKAIS